MTTYTSSTQTTIDNVDIKYGMNIEYKLSWSPVKLVLQSFGSFKCTDFPPPTPTSWKKGYMFQITLDKSIKKYGASNCIVEQQGVNCPHWPDEAPRAEMVPGPVREAPTSETQISRMSKEYRDSCGLYKFKKSVLRNKMMLYECRRKMRPSSHHNKRKATVPCKMNPEPASRNGEVISCIMQHPMIRYKIQRHCIGCCPAPKTKRYMIYSL